MHICTIFWVAFVFVCVYTVYTHTHTHTHALLFKSLGLLGFLECIQLIKRVRKLVLFQIYAVILNFIFIKILLKRIMASKIY